MLDSCETPDHGIWFDEKTPCGVPADGYCPPSRNALVLRVLQAPTAGDVGRTMPLVDRISVGRRLGPGANLVVHDAGLSRAHFTIERKGHSVVLTDHESTNGTWLNRMRVQCAPVAQGSIVRASDTIFFFGLVSESASSDHGFIRGSSLPIELLRRDVARVAASALPVLVLGETGTGKDLVARQIHAASGRPGPLIAVNCGAIPTTLGEAAFFGHKKGSFTGATADAQGHWLSANGGTLFLDEVGELPLEVQPKLLRVLDSGDVTPVGGTSSRHADVRVVAATNADLPRLVSKGLFRRDLYARLNGMVLRPPPLRNRRDDILALFAHFTERYGRHFRPSTEFTEQMLLYDWDMNVRELEALAQRLSVVVEGDLLLPTHLPREVLDGSPAARRQARRDPTKDALVEALKAANGNVAVVAEHFRRARKQIYRWLEKYSIDVGSFRP